MNWLSTSADVACALRNDTWTDLCEHVEQDRSLAYLVLKEDDSFGPVLRNIVCRDCAAKYQEDEDNTVRVCCDCKKIVPQKEGFFWRWYDFYAAQGDEPLFVCNSCYKGPAHRARVLRDQAEEQKENERYERRRESW